MSLDLQRDGWNEWTGKEAMPLYPLVRVLLRCGAETVNEPDEFTWEIEGVGSDIVAWKPVEAVEVVTRTEVDPYGKDPHEPGAKLDAGKVKAGVLHDFSSALFDVARVGTYGAEKYTRGGWQSVPNARERYFDAMWRHLLASRHEAADKDTGLKHLAHAAWNILAVLELEARGPAA